MALKNNQELGYGFYDGLTGVVTQPMLGMKENGALGLVTGIGKGLGGLVLKPGAGECPNLISNDLCLTRYVRSDHRHRFLGLFGLPAYALQGVSQELHNLFVTDFGRHIALSRLSQGRDEMGRSSMEEQEQVVAAWGRLCNA
jgi:hypothetical protein